jgi:hypothetical protein
MFEHKCKAECVYCACKMRICLGNFVQAIFDFDPKLKSAPDHSKDSETGENVDKILVNPN